eukprot:8521674-Heterocapsa_arctica.AAC.1
MTLSNSRGVSERTDGSNLSEKSGKCSMVSAAMTSGKSSTLKLFAAGHRPSGNQLVDPVSRWSTARAS